MTQKHGGPPLSRIVCQKAIADALAKKERKALARSKGLSQGGSGRGPSEPSVRSKKALRKARRAIATSELNDEELEPLVDMKITNIFEQPTLDPAIQAATGHIQAPSLD